MRLPNRKLSFVAIFALFSPLVVAVSAQTNNLQPRITQAVDETKLTVLHGNTHPLARAEFDRGAAPADLPMERMLLVLKRSPEQEAALDQLLAEQQDESSPNYHKWLTPAQFGQQFGVADSDIRTITWWLESHGFQIGNVSNGRTLIEFSGTAGEVQEALHAPIHSYIVNGEQHWANANDPSIPTALTPAIAGVATLHDFYPKPQSHIRGPFPRPQAASQSTARPQLSFAATSACSLVQFLDPSLTSHPTECFMLGPADLATIYNVLPLWNAGIDGTGETIAIVDDSNINPEDAATFRTIYGLPPQKLTVTVNGTDPGLAADESEAILDVEWSGAVAPGANINLVVSKSTNATFGGDLSAVDIVDNDLAPILSESYGACEPALTSAYTVNGVNYASANVFYNSTWQQAAGEGITVIVSTGDNGSAACDIDVITGPPSQPAVNGLQVNGIASTPYNVAVGGTDFNDLTNPTQYWSLSNNATTLASALGYIPETTWNDSCTNAIFVTLGYGANAEASCNDHTGTLKADGVIIPVGGSGGESSVYPKPSWQSALTPADGARDLPDISLFAGDGTISASFYYFCESDLVKGSPQCSLSSQIFGAGGTSVSAQAFAGMMALLDQKYEDKQGLINSPLYPLAKASGNTCASAANPASTCVFYNETAGTIAMPCKTGTPNCVTNVGGDSVGVLSGWGAGAGYNLATGLGSVNAANFVNASNTWATTTAGNDFTVTLNSPTVIIPNPGSPGMVTLTVHPNGTFAGTVTLSCTTALPTGVTCSGPNATSPNWTSTITFTSTASGTPNPSSRPDHFGLPGTVVSVALLCLFCMGLLLPGLWNGKRRWSTALAFVVLAFVLMSAACGGSGSGGGGGGGTPLGNTFIEITATSGSIQRSASVELTIN